MTQGQILALPAGTKIAVFEIKEVIHRDSSGITYRAWNKHLNSTVTVTEFLPSVHAIRDQDGVKVIPKSAVDQVPFETGLTHFQAHSETLIGIQHPGIIAAHNALHFNGTAYCVLDDNKGIPFANWLETSNATLEDRLIEFLRLILAALQKLHEQGVAHGDIHASNIYINNDVPVLNNFSATRLAIAGNNETLQQELRSGYAAAELYSSQGAINPGSDIYALGALMYAAISHLEPVSALDRKKAMSSGQPDPLRSCFDLKNTEFNENFLTVIDSMLKLDISKRPQSVQDVLKLLDKDAVEAQAAHPIDQQSGAKKSSMLQAGLWSGAIIIAIILAINLWTKQTDEHIAPPSAQVSQAAPAVDEEQALHNPDVEVDVQQPLDKTSNEIVQKQPSIPDQDRTPLLSDGGEQAEKTAAILGDTMRNNNVLPQQESPAPTNVLTTETEYDVQSEIQSTAKVAAREKLITQYLTAADNNIVALKLSTPPGDNAYLLYQEILKLQPNNIEAQTGLKHIVEIYIFFIENAMLNNRFQLAKTYLRRAEMVMPEAAGLDNLRVALETN
jgi:serine/threonine protein kinase